MEMTESYRQPAPDISKTDFFDFVTSNDISDAQFKQQMRQVNVFMESPDSRSNPLLSEEPKERNNNILNSVNNANIVTNSAPVSTPASSTTTLQSFDSIWNVDRERDRLETAMLEDLNKFYWSPESEQTSCATDKLIGDNTDGQIYTLTVLNQDVNDQNNSRYWCKEEDVSLSSPTPMEQIQQSSLDLESILNIMPNQINGFPNEFGQGVLVNETLTKVDSFAYEDSQTEVHTDELGAVKVEHYQYDDREFSATNDTEEAIQTQNTQTQQLVDTQMEFNDNNNDWKLSDRNSESNDSLLRSALQGKAFIRYSNNQKNIIGKIATSEDLKRVIINNNKLSAPNLYRDGEENVPETTERLVMTLASPTNIHSHIICFEDPNANIGENPTSTQSVDDILLSQLDATYPGDFEKIKKIANEVAESVQQYCTVEPANTARSVFNIQQFDGEIISLIQAPEVTPHLQIVTASPTVSSTKSVTKKYKRSQSKNNSMQQNTTAIQPATSTSNGIRKERSLHYCSICSKGFKDKYSVNVHVRTHTGEKPFACSLCGKSFRQKAHLAKHYQTHIAQKTATANGTAKATKQR